MGLNRFCIICVRVLRSTPVKRDSIDSAPALALPIVTVVGGRMGLSIPSSGSLWGAGSGGSCPLGSCRICSSSSQILSRVGSIGVWSTRGMAESSG